MKNTYAWAIIVIVLILAGGAIWFMMNKGDVSPVDTTGATAGQTKGATHATTGVKSGTTGTTGTSGAASTDTRPKITSISPASGKVAAIAMIKGTHFDSATNVITFGPSLGLHRTDGSADNEVATIASSDGMTLSFQVPTSIGSGNLCDQNNKCATYGPKATAAGTYMVTVVNKNGLSNEFPFTVTN